MQDLRLILLVVGTVFIALLMLHGIWSSKKEKSSKFAQAKKRSAWEKRESRTRTIQQEIQRTPVPPSIDPLADHSSASSFSEESTVSHLPEYKQRFLDKIRQRLTRKKEASVLVKSTAEQRRLLDDAFNGPLDSEEFILPEDYQPPRRQVIEDPSIDEPILPEFLQSIYEEEDQPREMPSILVRKHETSSTYSTEHVPLDSRMTPAQDRLRKGVGNKQSDMPIAFNTDVSLHSHKKQADPLLNEQQSNESRNNASVVKENREQTRKIEPIIDPLIANYDDNVSMATSGDESMVASRDIDQASLSTTIQTQTIASKSTMSAHQNNSSQQQRQAQSSEVKQQPTDNCIIHVRAFGGDELYNGKALIECMLRYGLRFGKMGMYHRFANFEDDGGEPMFSVANMIAPGTFNVKRLEDLYTPGLSLFMLLPCQGDPERNFKLMVETAQQIASDLGGIILDDARHLITPQKLADYKAKIKRFNYASSSVKSKFD